LRYNTGIGGALAGPASYTQLGKTYPGQTSTVADCPADGSNTRCRTINGANNASPTAVAGTLAAPFAEFVAQSRSQLISGSLEDIWTINQDKNMVNTSDGTM